MTSTIEGWLGVLPKGWALVPAKAAFAERREPNRPEDVHLTPSQIHGVLPQSEYTSRTGNSVVQNLRGQDSMKHVEPDDFIIHLRSFQGGIERSTYAGKVSTAYTVLAPKQQVVADYFRWLLKSDGYIQELRTTTNQLRDGQSIKFRDFAKVPLPFPPVDEQRAIADYLNRETARIDTLIDEQQRLIELLRERRHSLVDGVFNAHSPNVRLQSACLDVVDCPHTTPEFAEHGEYEAVRTASVRQGKFRPGNGILVSFDTWKARNVGGAPVVGDILFTREAPAGEACMVPSDLICLGQRMVLLRIDSTVCSGEFLLWQIYADRVQDHFALSANGSTVANVRLPVLRTTPIWLPDLDEQKRIVAQLDGETTKIDTLIVEAERFVELSRERRSALTAAAVTGQIDVRVGWPDG